MTDIAALSRHIENLFRLGTVIEVDHGSLQDKRPTQVRVQSGNLLTGWLPWTALRADATCDWNPSTAGEQGVVLTPNGQTAQGIASGSMISALIPANGDRADLHRRTYPDGSVVEYWPQPWLTSRLAFAAAPESGQPQPGTTGPQGPPAAAP